ncbi:MAG: alanine:cation symporter family protein, partial [Lachnospiraceae bacterium]|nr:alanine:cation symporter family protein [Lachnospiraceae bacterium]
AEAGTNGIIFVQLACQQVMGSIAPLFIAIMLFLFSFTCLISYYYEAETAAMYLFQGEGKANIRKAVTRIMQVGMPILIFIWGIIESDLAWNLSDLALGACTWINMVIVLALSPKAVALYHDYEDQMKAKKDPYYNPDKLSWKGVDTEMWKDINKKYIEADK